MGGEGIFVIGLDRLGGIGEGFVDVYGQQDADHYRRIARIPTGAGARTSLFVSEQKRLYVAVPHRGAQGAKVLVYASQP